MEKKGTWLVPTLSVIQRYALIGSSSGSDLGSLEKSRTILTYQSEAFHRALQHHLRIAFGLDDDPDFLPKEFSAMVKGGLKPIEALQAATIHAASRGSSLDSSPASSPARSSIGTGRASFSMFFLGSLVQSSAAGSSTASGGRG